MKTYYVIQQGDARASASTPVIESVSERSLLYPADTCLQAVLIAAKSFGLGVYFVWPAGGGYVEAIRVSASTAYTAEYV